LDKTGKLKSYYKLDKDDFPQPESITFSAKGDLYISTEGMKKSGTISKVIIESVIQIDDKKRIRIKTSLVNIYQNPNV